MHRGSVGLWRGGPGCAGCHGLHHLHTYNAWRCDVSVCCGQGGPVTPTTPPQPVGIAAAVWAAVAALCTGPLGKQKHTHHRGVVAAGVPGGGWAAVTLVGPPACREVGAGRPSSKGHRLSCCAHTGDLKAFKCHITCLPPHSGLPCCLLLAIQPLGGL